MARVRFAILIAAMSFLPLPARAQVTLAVKRLPGRTTQRTERTVVEHIFDVMGMKVEIAEDTTTVLTDTVGQTGVGGETPVTVRYDAIAQTKRDVQGPVLRYDSRKRNSKTDDWSFNLLIEGFDATIGTELTYRFATNGAVASVDGLEATLQRLPRSVAHALRTQLKSARLMADRQQEIDRLPTDPVNAGDTWLRTEVLATNMGIFVVERQYEYAGVTRQDGRSFDHIRFSDRSIAQPASPNPAEPELVSYDNLKIQSSEGTLLFDREAGETVECDASLRFTGVLKSPSENGDFSAEMDISILRSTRVAPVRE